MKIRLVVVPGVNVYPTDRPRSCRYCEGAILQRHSTVSKPIKDHRATEVELHRYKCRSCARTFRYYPSGVSSKDQSRRTVVLAAVVYGLSSLLLGSLAPALGSLGVGVSKMSVWRDAQEAGEALREKRPAGRVRILGADDTAFKVKGKEVVLGFVVNGSSAKTLGFEVLFFEGDGVAFRRWLLEPYAKGMGAEVLLSLTTTTPTG